MAAQYPSESPTMARFLDLLAVLLIAGKRITKLSFGQTIASVGSEGHVQRCRLVRLKFNAGAPAFCLTLSLTGRGVVVAVPVSALLGRAAGVGFRAFELRQRFPLPSGYAHEHFALQQKHR